MSPGDSHLNDIQIETLIELLDKHWSKFNEDSQDALLKDILYRYRAIGLDKRWEGIPRDVLEIFSELKKSLPQEDWENFPAIFAKFRQNKEAYKKLIADRERRAFEAEQKRIQEIEALKELKRLEEIKEKEAREAAELAEKQARLQKHLAMVREKRKLVSEKSEKLRRQAWEVSHGGRMAVPHEFDRNYADAVYEESFELCKEAILSGEIEFSVRRIEELVMQGNPNSRALANYLGARNSQAEIVIAFLFLGNAARFIAPLWRGRPTEKGNVIDQLYALNLSLVYAQSLSQALTFSTYFPEPADLASKVKIVNKIYECIKSEKADIQTFLPTIVKYIPLEAMDSEILELSMKVPRVGDWRARFYRLLDKNPHDHFKIMESANRVSPGYLRLVYDEYLALNGDLDVMTRLLNSKVQSSFGMEVTELSPIARAEYIEKLVASNRGTPEMATVYLLQDGVPKKQETITNLLEMESLLREDFVGLAELGFGFCIPDKLLENLESRKYQENDDLFELRKRLLFACKKLDDLLLLDAEREFTDEDDVINLALISLEQDEYGVCRQLLERNFGTFNSILEIEAISQLPKSKLVDFLPYILKYENITNPVVINEVAEIEISEGRRVSAAARLRPLVDSGSAEAAALMLLAETPNSETPFDEIELALKTSDLEMRIVAIREIAKRYALLGNHELARAHAESIASEDIESAYLLATIVQDLNTSTWARDVLDRTNIAEQEQLKATFMSYGFSTSTELEDYNLHKHLITPNTKNSQSRDNNKAIRVSEEWYCRKAMLQDAANLNSERMVLSYDFSSCRIHNVAFKQRVQFGFRIPSNHSIDQVALKNFLQDAVPRNLDESATPSMKLILDDLKEGGFTPRSWQEEAFSEWIKHGRHGMIEAVTGSGKSYLGALAAAEALDDGYAVLIVVPTQILCDQWIEGPLRALHKKNLINKIGNARSNIAPDAFQIVPGKITVAVMKSIVDNPDYLPGNHINSCLIADEIHNYGGPETSKVLGANFRRRLGMTATLADSESLGFFKNYFGGDAIYAYEFRTAVLDKAVSNYDLVMIGVQPNDLEKDLYTEAEYQVRMVRQELILKFGIPRDTIGFEKGLAALENAEKGTEIVAKYKALKRRADSIVANSQSKLKAIYTVSEFLSKRGNTIVFSDVNSNAKNVQQILANEGVLGEVVNAEVSPSERRIFVDKLFRNELSALISPKALDEGIDIKGLTVGLFVGVQGQRRRLIQRLGRVLRVQEGKRKPVVIIPFNVGSNEDPNIAGNHKLQLGKFDFIGENADSIRDFHVNDELEIKNYLDSLV